MTATLDLSSLHPGFSDPARDSQRAFRALMEATARPGTIARFDTPAATPEGLGRAAAAVLLTLVDQDTPLWLDAALQTAPVATWLRFHCGCRVVGDPALGSFAVVADGHLLPDLAAFNQGDARFPDRAATVLIQVESLTGGGVVDLSGPGIAGITQISPKGLAPAFWDTRTQLVAHFQFGMDIMLCAGNALVSLPRTTRASVKGV